MRMPGCRTPIISYYGRMKVLNIKVLGPGCSNCYLLEGLVIAALEFMAEDENTPLDLEQVTLQHLSDRQDFYRYGLLYTPGLVINEKLVCAGRLPSALEIREWLRQALHETEATVQEDIQR